MKFKLGILVGLILLAAFLRLLPHPANFSPVMAIALFAGAFLAPAISSNWRFLAWLVPLAALFLSDLVLGFYSVIPFVYGAMILGVVVGQLLAPFFSPTFGSTNDKKFSTIFSATTLAAIVASLLFFAISNFGVWFEGQLYPLTTSGFISCYVAALPFLFKSLAGDLAYTYLLFGAWLTLRQTVPSLSEVSSNG